MTALPPSSAVLNALAGAGPQSIEWIANVVCLPRESVDNALGLLVAGCYVVREGGLYRRSTREERAAYYAQDAERAGRR